MKRVYQVTATFTATALVYVDTPSDAIAMARFEEKRLLDERNGDVDYEVTQAIDSNWDGDYLILGDDYGITLDEALADQHRSEAA
jgi:hypothetical protein